MILCEQCGNEFKYGKMTEKNGKRYINCPYCNYGNKPLYRKRKVIITGNSNGDNKRTFS